MPNSIANNDTKDLDNHHPGQVEDEIDIGVFLGVLFDGKWMIAIVTLVMLTIGIAKAFLDSPVYKTDAMLQVNETSQTMTGLEPVDILNSNMPVMAEIELIKSRMILGEAVKNLDLEIIAKPKYFPLIGEAIARRFQQHNQDNAVSSPLFGQSQYAWGGEAIQVETFIVPAGWEDEELIFLAGEQGSFQLLHDDELILDGEVGKLATQQLGGSQQSIAIFVSRLKSRPGTKFSIIRQSENGAISELNDNLTVTEKGKSSGILELTLESNNIDSAVAILNEIANIYVRQNVEQKSAESQKTLEFLEKQLPILKEQLDTTSDTLNDYRNRKGSVDLDIETQNILAGIVETKTQITLLEQKRDELRQRYTESHPNVIAIDRQIARLQEQMLSLDNMIKVLPETQQVILGLSGDVQVSAGLYTTLLNNAQTLRVTRAGTVGDVRIIDYAVLPDQPIKPRKLLIIVITFVLGLFLGIVIVFIRKALHRGIEDPNLIEKQLNIPVYATVPHSKEQELIIKKTLSKNSDSDQLGILTIENSEDLAIESLRSLRTSLHFALLEAKNNIILITGPSPGVGKSFISINLAAVMADAGKKILLIDGDLRKGAINKFLGVNRENGLSEVILKTIAKKKATRKIPVANFDFIPTGYMREVDILVDTGGLKNILEGEPGGQGFKSEVTFYVLGTKAEQLEFADMMAAYSGCLISMITTRSKDNHVIGTLESPCFVQTTEMDTGTKNGEKSGTQYSLYAATGFTTNIFEGALKLAPTP